VPEISAMNVNATQPSGNALSGQLLLPLPIQWGPDVACASELQSMIATVLGTAPNWLTPDDAINYAASSKEPAIVFSVGLWSNPFSRFVCQDGEHSLQNLLRLPMGPDDGKDVVLPGWSGCRVLSATPTAGHVYDVDKYHEETKVPPGYQNNSMVLCRARGPALGNVSCVVLGGLTGAGTSVAGRYLKQHWSELCSMSDTSAPGTVIRGRQYLIDLKTFSDGVVATGQVRAGAELRSH
jgi:hypothetical protein